MLLLLLLFLIRGDGVIIYISETRFKTEQNRLLRVSQAFLNGVFIFFLVLKMNFFIQLYK